MLRLDSLQNTLSSDNHGLLYEHLESGIAMSSHVDAIYALLPTSHTVNKL